MPTSRCNSTGYRLGLACALLVVTLLSLSPAAPQPFPFDHGDKLAHLLTFGVLAFLADAGWPEKGLFWYKLLPLSLYGAAIEIGQYFVPNRFFSLLDILADVAGVVLYFVLFLPLLRRLALR